MQEAGVNLVAVGIFGWAPLEPRPGDTTSAGWTGSRPAARQRHPVNLATATSSPPPWLTTPHPEILPVTADGDPPVLGQPAGVLPQLTGVPRAAAGLAGELARRYAGHPAVALWHVNNEFGCHDAHCYCDTSAEAFRRLAAAPLRRRSTRSTRPGARRSGASATATGTRSMPPRRARRPGATRPSSSTSRRFSSDELLGCYRAERDAVLRRLSRPCRSPPTSWSPRFKPTWTTGPGRRSWTSSPTTTTSTDRLGDRTSSSRFAADLTRGPGRRQPVAADGAAPPARSTGSRATSPRRPGQLRRQLAVARGPRRRRDLFFQWRASRAGCREVPLRAACRTPAPTPRPGARSRRSAPSSDALGAVTGSRVHGRASAILFDWESWWARRAGQPPVGRRRLPRPGARRAPTRCWRRRHHGRRRPPGRRPEPLPAGARAQPVPGHRRAARRR